MHGPWLITTTKVASFEYDEVQKSKTCYLKVLTNDSRCQDKWNNDDTKLCYKMLGVVNFQRAMLINGTSRWSCGKPLEFQVGDHVMLKVSPWKGVVRFAKKGKLTPRYVGPFEFVERIGPVAYRLRLPDELSGVHDVFHVLNLKKCLVDETLIIPVEEIQLDEHLHFVEEPLEIMDRKVKKLRRSRIPIVKVRWNSKRGPEFTWEREDSMKLKYPQLFAEEAVPDSNA
ncbi:hypothetical protein E3N88_20489 [Mikania micrantha]|uniref:Tf2-1-like SH3-like domain-containing protein n=1 Tax=Mikania micrantha TaxID=192012 RepID=A0A5N6NH41_9ASTR|nr:hypothetical protein E3N88_20489 [Mikania micrantha]